MPSRFHARSLPLKEKFKSDTNGDTILWDYLTMTLNPFWHRVFGSCRSIGNCSTVHVATDQVQRLREPGVAQVWLSSSARKTKSREERGNFMKGSRTRMIEEALPSGLGLAAWSTRYMCGFQPAGHQWLRRGCLAGQFQWRLPKGLPRRNPEPIPWRQSRQEAAGSGGAMADGDSTKVVYKIRQWSLPGATVVPVLNVSSRVFWLELDDKALLDSYTVLQEGILCDVFSQKCSAAWQGAPGQRLTVAVMLPGRQDADHWLNFMLSQKNLWPTFTTRGTLTEEISEQTFRKERRRLQAKHLWMEVRLSWHVLGGRMYTAAPTGKSRDQLYALLFDKAARGGHKNPYEEKAYRGPDLTAVQTWWEQCKESSKEWMHYFKGQSAPVVPDLHGQGGGCSCWSRDIYGALCKEVAD